MDTTVEESIEATMEEPKQENNPEQKVRGEALLTLFFIFVGEIRLLIYVCREECQKL